MAKNKNIFTRLKGMFNIEEEAPTVTANDI
jgi:hypothetical protein